MQALLQSRRSVLEAGQAGQGPDFCSIDCECSLLRCAKNMS